jgi:5-methylcytosine-specific restriction endonuclease McrA
MTFTREPLGFHLRLGVFRRDGYQCRHCGCVARADELEVDHIVPVSLGGADEPENLQTLCRPCNRRKGNRYSG